MELRAQASQRDPVLLEIKGLTVTYPDGRSRFGLQTNYFRAVDNVSFRLTQGETIGIVGESGSGKSTLGRAILDLAPVAAGDVLVEGRDVRSMRGYGHMRLSCIVQCIFQDPYSSLSPSHTVDFILREPLVIHGLPHGAAQIDALLDLVGLPIHLKSRRPSELSGGQCQRVAIARALALNPKLIICDEPTSSLDVSIQAQIVALLADFAARMNLSYIFISHDLAVVQQIAARVMVMFAGQVVEEGETQELFSSPLHPYTAALLSAVPVPDPTMERSRPRLTLSDDTIEEVPSYGCRFRNRCWLWQDLGQPEVCATRDPRPPVEQNELHRSACHFPQEVTLKLRRR